MEVLASFGSIWYNARNYNENALCVRGGGSGCNSDGRRVRIVSVVARGSGRGPALAARLGTNPMIVGELGFKPAVTDVLAAT